MDPDAPLVSTRLSDCSLRPLASVPPGTSVRQAARRMREENVSALLVAEPGQLVSILTERDLVLGLARGIDPDGPVDALAAPDPVTLERHETVGTGARLMMHHGIRHLVVTSDQRAVGIVSVRDVIAALLHSEPPDTVVALVREIVIDRPENWLG
jgi:CBS domain-containing protein